MAKALSIVNPATGRAIHRVECDTPEIIARKVQRARVALPDWSRLSVEARVAILRRFSASLKEETARLARTLTSEMGKPIAQSRAEITATPERIEFFLRHVQEVLAEEVVHREGGCEERIRWEPLGVVANISAWNYPYFVGSNVFVPALLAGNTVLYKPSEHALLTGMAMVELLHKAGVPEEAVQVVAGDGRAGEALVNQPIDALCFTGSYATGRSIAERVAGRLLRLQLELGGKDPAYVCEDAPLQPTVAALADGVFYNAGQSCCAVERIYVHRSLYDRFVEAFVEHTRGLRVGDPMEEGTDVGPLARRAQLTVLEDQVRDAQAKRARLRCGGRRLAGSGFFFEPTVFGEADHRMKLMREESFGPVIGIQAVEDDTHATTQMRDTEYGLTAAVYTPDRQRAERILSKIPTGTVYWNCCDRISPRLPWSGRRRSGIGVTLSREGIRTFVQPKAWHLVG